MTNDEWLQATLTTPRLHRSYGRASRIPVLAAIQALVGSNRVGRYWAAGKPRTPTSAAREQAVEGQFRSLGVA